MGPMSEIEFRRYVRANGFYVVQTKKEWQVVDQAGHVLLPFAVSHKKGGKREIKACYVRDFQKNLKLY